MEREVYLWLKEELFQIPKAGGKLSTRELKKNARCTSAPYLRQLYPQTALEQGI